MRYLKWIEQYKQKELSSTDRQAFEHELMDNARLQAEKEAHDLADKLLFAAAIGSLGDPASVKAEGRSNTSYWQIGSLIIALCLIIFFVWRNLSLSVSTDTAPLQESPTPEKQTLEPDFVPQEQIVPSSRPPVAILSPSPSSPDLAGATDREPDKTKRATSNRKESAAPAKAVAVLQTDKFIDKEPEELSNRSKIAIYTVRGVLDTVLSETTDVALTATEVIVLKPGFHARAGTSFKARVNTGPLFERSDVPK